MEVAIHLAELGAGCGDAGGAPSQCHLAAPQAFHVARLVVSADRNNRLDRVGNRYEGLRGYVCCSAGWAPWLDRTVCPVRDGGDWETVRAGRCFMLSCELGLAVGPCDWSGYAASAYP